MAAKRKSAKKQTAVVDEVVTVVKTVPEVKHLMVGYGTFITRAMFNKDSHPRVVTVKGFKRVFDPKLAWYPFVLPDPTSSFKGIVFDVKSDQELTSKDHYESCRGDPLKDDENAGLYYRAQTDIVDIDGVTKKAWIYVPSKRTREQYRVTIDMDDEDGWLGEIAKMLSHNDDATHEWMKMLLPDGYVIPKQRIVEPSTDDEEDKESDEE